MLLCKDLIDRSSPPLSEMTSEGNQCILYKESKAVILTTVRRKTRTTEITYRSCTKSVCRSYRDVPATSVRTHYRELLSQRMREYVSVQKCLQ